MNKIVILLFTLIYYSCAKHEEYDGHSVYGVTVNNKEQVNKLMDLIERLNLDVWKEANPDDEGLILVPLTTKPVFEDEITSIGGSYRIETENIKVKLDLEDELMAEATSNRTRLSRAELLFNSIPRYEAVDKYLTDVANSFPKVARVVSAGKSVEGRDIKYLGISSNNFEDKNKSVVFMQSLLHAREWITLPVTLWAIKKLVFDITEQDLTRDLDWIILPIANPDGYEFSHTKMRFWRKNRRIGQRCVGVDLNRNYDFDWGTMSSNNSCSEIYHGPKAFSEPETRATRDILEQFKDRIGLYLDIHSFGSLILYGYGNGHAPPNSATLNEVAIDMALRIDTVKWQQNRNYKIGNIAQVLYYATGDSSDYAQVTIGKPLSYTFELPAYKNQNMLSGFLVDPAFIPQAGYETWEGIKIAARYVVKNKEKSYDF